jgi:ribonucleoside-diphosphate reductase alpha chain
MPARDELPPAEGGATSLADQPKGTSAGGASLGVKTADEQSTTKTDNASADGGNSPAATASVVSGGASSAARDDLAVVATNGHANGHTAKSNGNGAGVVTLSLGATNVAFKIQEDAPSCAECGSIMVRNGSCYKCLNCGSTSGCS